jgi:ribosomal protein L7/L12
MADERQLAAELLDLLAAGRKIEAIKRYRAATGASLAEAKDVIERLQRRDFSLPSAGAIDSDVEREVLAELERSGKIAAIRVYRSATGVGLKEAKDAVEAIAERHGLSQVKSGCASILLLVMGITSALWIAMR